MRSSRLSRPDDGGLEIAHDLARPDWQQLAPEVAGDERQDHVDEPVGDQQPHGGEVPEQRAGQPAAERDAGGKCEAEQRRGIVDLPSRPNHDQDGHRVDPVRDAHVERMDERPVQPLLLGIHIGSAVHGPVIGTCRMDYRD